MSCEQISDSKQEFQTILYELTAMVASGGEADGQLVKRIGQLIPTQTTFDPDTVLRLGFLQGKTHGTPNEADFTALFSQLPQEQQQWYRETSSAIKQHDPRLHPQRALWK